MMPAKLIRPGRVVAFTLLLLGGVVMVTPLLFMLATSLKTGSEVYDLNFLPRAPTLGNYVEILTHSPFGRWFAVSTAVATITTLSVVFFDSLIGYTLAKFRFRGRGIVFVAILSTLMIPTEMLVIPWYVMAKSMGWLDTLWGIMFPGMMSGFGVFLMRQFFLGVPDELIDAARIDGLNEFQIYWQVALPLVTPALSALAIFAFLGNWTAFLWPLIVTTSPNLYTVPVGLASLSGEFQTDWEMIMTGASIATIPTLVVFIVLQRNIIAGIMLTGLKG
jgi:multiple sugar transport system permease protein